MTPRRALLLAFTAIGLLTGPTFAQDLAAPGPYFAGTMAVTVSRPNGSTFAATLHYPALSDGAGAPFDNSGAPYPAITFGHGFLQAVTQYTSTIKHLATHGFFVIASQSEGGLFPSHGNFASDLRHSLSWLEQQHALANSPFFAAVQVDRFGASGHSMGGGAALLATAADQRIVAVATTAAAETSPSAIAALALIDVPIRLIAGSDDSIVPPESSLDPMYAGASAPKQALLIDGGFHCGFTDGSFLFCDSGAITRPAQLAITRRLLTEFFLAHLRRDQSLWPAVWGPELPDPSETSMLRDAGIAIALSKATLSAAPGFAAGAQLTITNTGPIASTFSFFTEPVEGWSTSWSMATSPLLPPGATAVVTLTAHASFHPIDIDLLISARREADGATRGYATATLVALPPTPDFNGDGAIDGADLGVLLSAWGPGPSIADLNEDGVVDGDDLGILLSVWE